MADVMLELVTKKTEKKPSRKKGSTNKTRGSATSIRARAEAKRIKELEKEANKDGLEQLRREADIRVGRNAAKLAELLTDSALKGDLNSTKTLVGWAEKKKPVAAVKKGKSFLERLTKNLKSQGEWKGPMDEKLGEVGEGGVEPENSGQ
jgi:predicted nucleotidyltransferase